MINPQIAFRDPGTKFYVKEILDSLNQAAMERTHDHIFLPLNITMEVINAFEELNQIQVQKIADL